MDEDNEPERIQLHCSWCHRLCTQVMTERNVLIRSVYSCSHCQECVPLPFPRSPHQNTLSAASPSTVLASGRGLAHDAWLDACGWSRRTVLCQNSVCEGAAKGGIFWDNDVCSVCDGTIDRWPRQNPSENPASPLGYVETTPLRSASEDARQLHGCELSCNASPLDTDLRQHSALLPPGFRNDFAHYDEANPSAVLNSSSPSTPAWAAQPPPPSSASSGQPWGSRVDPPGFEDPATQVRFLSVGRPPCAPLQSTRGPRTGHVLATTSNLFARPEGGACCVCVRQVAIAKSIQHAEAGSSREQAEVKAALKASMQVVLAPPSRRAARTALEHRLARTGDSPCGALTRHRRARGRFCRKRCGRNRRALTPLGRWQGPRASQRWLSGRMRPRGTAVIPCGACAVPLSSRETHATCTKWRLAARSFPVL